MLLCICDDNKRVRSSCSSHCIFVSPWSLCKWRPSSRVMVAAHQPAFPTMHGEKLPTTGPDALPPGQNTRAAVPASLGDHKYPQLPHGQGIHRGFSFSKNHTLPIPPPSNSLVRSLTSDFNFGCNLRPEGVLHRSIRR